MRKILNLICFVFLLNFSWGNSAFAGSNNLYLQRAKQFLIQSNFDSALTYFNSAKVGFEKESYYSGISSCLNSLAEIQKIKGNNNHALEHLEESRAIILNHIGKDCELLAQCDDLTGAAYHELDDIEKAVFYYRESLLIRLNLYGENDARTAFAYKNIAGYFSFKQQHDSAYYYAEKAMNICRSYPEHIKSIKLESIIKEYAYDYGNWKRIEIKDWVQYYDSVRYYYFEALKIIRRNYPSPNYYESTLLHSIGNSYTDLVCKNRDENKKNHPYFLEALNYYNQDLAIKIKLFGVHHPSVSTTYFTFGLLYAYSEEPNHDSISLIYHQKAIMSLLPLSGEVDVLSVPTIDSCINYYELNILLTAKTLPLQRFYRLTKDIKYLKSEHEHNKVRVKLWDHIMQSFKSEEASQVIHLWIHTPFEEAAQSAIKLFHITGDSTYLNEMFYFSEKAKNSELTKSLMQSFNSETKDNSKQVFNNEFLAGDVVSITNIQNSLIDSTTAFIEYLKMPDKLDTNNFLFLITKNNFRVFEISNSHQIDSMILNMRNAIENTSIQNFRKSSYMLYASILKPAIIMLDTSIRKLIIVPHGLYSLIPFDALLTDSIGNRFNDFRQLPYLIRKYETSYALSASLLNYNKTFPSSENKTIAGFAPVFSNLSALPFSSKQLKSISGIADGNYYFGADAKASTFINSAPNNSVIHLATHGVADLEHPENSKIYFSSDTALKNNLTLNEIYSLKLNSDLAVLSACETSIGREMYAEGLKSFARAFAYAGCKSTVTTLWKVDDKATSMVLEEFYANLFAGQTKNDALYQAKINYLNNCKTSNQANPLYWSGIVLTGDVSSLKLKMKNSYPYGWIATTTILIIGFAAWKKRKTQ